MQLMARRCNGLDLFGGALLAISVASCGGGGSASTPTGPTTSTVAAVATLASVALSPASVVGGTGSQGTVTLSAGAPAGGAVVTLSSSNTVAMVPGSVTVAAGATTAVFAVTTSAVTDAVSVTVTATMTGVTLTAPLAVTPVPLAASFTVNSASRGADACVIVDGGANLDCTFDGRASTGSPKEWVWVYFVGANQGGHSSSEGITRPNAGCNFLRNQTPTTVGAVQFIQMEVRLKVRDARGIESPEVVNRNVRMFPNNLCGYGF